MTSKTRSPEASRGSRSLSAIKLLMLIVLIALVPLASREIEIDPENVRIIGRSAVGLGAAVVLYALIKQMGKIVLVLAIAVLAFAILVSEGLIDLPTLTG